MLFYWIHPGGHEAGGGLPAEQGVLVRARQLLWGPGAMGEGQESSGREVGRTPVAPGRGFAGPGKCRLWSNYWAQWASWESHKSQAQEANRQTGLRHLVWKKRTVWAVKGLQVNPTAWVRQDQPTSPSSDLIRWCLDETDCVSTKV